MDDVLAFSSAASTLSDLDARRTQARSEVARREPAIVVEGADYFFGEGEARKQALHGIDLTIGRGELIIMTGPSGSGKTTLLTVIGCLRAAQAGSVRLLGQELVGADEATLVAMRRRLGFIFQAHNLHKSLTAIRNVRMGLEVHGPEALAEWRRHCAHMLGILGLEDRLDYLPQNLSGGQKQRVAIARALVGNPEVVFADEPTAALDKESGRVVIDLLRRLADERGTTTLLVTHDNRILDSADRIVHLEDGRLVAAP
ncbi:MAG: ATP-binding cassette domain-containing protein [Methylobacteriaceae bacterium]|nr:ATP-binding cassette domain-containing protein [Methylobacteriaceae bacterium]